MFIIADSETSTADLARAGASVGHCLGLQGLNCVSFGNYWGIVQIPRVYFLGLQYVRLIINNMSVVWRFCTSLLKVQGVDKFGVIDQASIPSTD